MFLDAYNLLQLRYEVPISIILFFNFIEYA